jgi:hypothetical protein
MRRFDAIVRNRTDNDKRHKQRLYRIAQRRSIRPRIEFLWVLFHTDTEPTGLDNIGRRFRMKKSAIVLAACFLLGSAWAQKSDAPGNATPTTQTKAANPPAVATKTYKGTLVDASCAGTGNVTQTTSAAGNTADRADAGAPVVHKSGKTDENAAAQGCAVSANTKEFGLRTNDGHVLRFDSVGNQRAEDAIKNQKKWNADAAAGKAISAKVTGTVDGDNVTVVTIN